MYQEGTEGHRDEDPEGIVHLKEGMEGSCSSPGEEVRRLCLEGGREVASLAQVRIQEGLWEWVNYTAIIMRNRDIPIYLGPLIIMPPGPPNPGGGPPNNALIKT